MNLHYVRAGCVFALMLLVAGVGTRGEDRAVPPQKEVEAARQAKENGAEAKLSEVSREASRIRKILDTPTDKHRNGFSQGSC